MNSMSGKLKVTLTAITAVAVVLALVIMTSNPTEKAPKVKKVATEDIETSEDVELSEEEVYKKNIHNPINDLTKRFDTTWEKWVGAVSNQSNFSSKISAIIEVEKELQEIKGDLVSLETRNLPIDILDDLAEFTNNMSAAIEFRIFAAQNAIKMAEGNDYSKRSLMVSADYIQKSAPFLATAVVSKRAMDAKYGL